MRGAVSNDRTVSFGSPASGSVSQLATYKGEVVKVVLDGIELENPDTREQAQDDEDAGHEEQSPEDCDNPDIPQCYGEICEIRRLDDFQSMCAFPGHQDPHSDIATLSRQPQGGREEAARPCEK